MRSSGRVLRGFVPILHLGVEELTLVLVEVGDLQAVFDDVVIVEGGRKRSLVKNGAIVLGWEDGNQGEQAVPDREVAEEEGGELGDVIADVDLVVNYAVEQQAVFLQIAGGAPHLLGVHHAVLHEVAHAQLVARQQEPHQIREVVAGVRVTGEFKGVFETARVALALLNSLQLAAVPHPGADGIQ